jgi:transcriptional regulator of met regulon
MNRRRKTGTGTNFAAFAKFAACTRIAHSIHGEKSGFRRITVTVPQEAYEQLIRESSRRKTAGEPNQLLSALLREALNAYLVRLQR